MRRGCTCIPCQHGLGMMHAGSAQLLWLDNRTTGARLAAFWPFDMLPVHFDSKDDPLFELGECTVRGCPRKGEVRAAWTHGVMSGSVKRGVCLGRKQTSKLTF